MSPVRLRLHFHSPFQTASLPWVAGLALSLPLAAWPNDPPQLKPMKVSAEAGKLAKSDADEHGTKVATAPPPPADPLDTLRQRLAGKLSGSKVKVPRYKIAVGKKGVCTLTYTNAGNEKYAPYTLVKKIKITKTGK